MIMTQRPLSKSLLLWAAQLFIDPLTVVDIMAGKCAGRRGVVNKIRITDNSGHVVVFVHVFNHHTGGTDLMMFEPIELKKSRLTPVRIERLQLLAALEE